MQLETIQECLPVLTKIISRKLENIQGKFEEIVSDQEREHSDPLLHWETYDDFWGKQLPFLIEELKDIQIINHLRIQLKGDLFDKKEVLN